MIRKKAQGGFALIAALLAIWILTALGMLVFSVTTQDVKMSSRVLGERKAFPAAESGITWLTYNFNPANPADCCRSNVAVNTNGDPGTVFGVGPSYSDATWIPKSGPLVFPITGYQVGSGNIWGRVKYMAQVTGQSTSYNSTVSVDVGIGYGPVDISTLYH